MKICYIAPVAAAGAIGGPICINSLVPFTNFLLDIGISISCILFIYHTLLAVIRVLIGKTKELETKGMKKNAFNMGIGLLIRYYPFVLLAIQRSF